MQHMCCHPYCSKSADQLCGKCHNARYCSREHQVKHWKQHKSICFPVIINKNNQLGRFLTASKDLKAGDIILSENPFVFGPTANIPPLCLGCTRSVDGSYLCPICGWPLCGQYCPAFSNHQRECELFAAAKQKPTIRDFGEYHPTYDCITPLRCLWMRDKEPLEWKKFRGLQSSVDFRKRTPNYKKTERFAIHLIRNVFKMDQFSEDEIHFVSGVLETNGFDIPANQVVTLYEKASLLEHSCVPNTTLAFGKNFRILIKAAIDISKGEHITGCYIDPFQNERIRKTQLLVLKYFDCICFRCQDPTEMGTHLSSIRCGFCKEGIITPPQDIMEDYVCPSCGERIESVEVEQNLASENDKLLSLPASVSIHEKFLKETKRHFANNHYLRFKAKISLFQLYGECGGLEQLSHDTLTNKIALGEELLAVASKITPGLSRMRGILMYELHRAYMEQYSRLINKHKTGEEGRRILLLLESMMCEAHKIYAIDNQEPQSAKIADELEEELMVVREILHDNSPKKLSPSKRKFPC